MTPRFRLALVGLAALAALTGALALLRTGGGTPSEGEAGGRAAAGPALPGAGLSPRTPDDGEPGGEDEAPSRGGGATGGLRPGLRAPEGVDLSDPEQRRRHLLGLIAERPLDWNQIVALVGLSTEPLDPAARAFLLEQLRTGDRNGAGRALTVCHDPAFVPELLALLDDPGAPAGMRRVAVLALAQMPGADRDELVRTLEGRLKGTGAADGELLGMIARRGGPEAARAITEYVARGGDGVRLAQSAVGQLDLVGDPAAAEVVAQALRRTASPEALAVLVRLASARPGAAGVGSALIALDRDDVPEAVRTQVLEALAQVGSLEATEHLLRVARQPGVYGERATLALANLGTTSPEAQEALLAAAERPGSSPRPELARASLLQAAGTMRLSKALPAMVSALDERDLQVKNGALQALGRMGPLARAHVEAIGQQFAAGSEATRIAVVVALGSIGGPEAAERLERLGATPDLGPQLQRTLGFALAQARGLPADDEGPDAERR